MRKINKRVRGSNKAQDKKVRKSTKKQRQVISGERVTVYDTGS